MGGQLDRAGRLLAGATRTTYHEQDGKIHLNTYQDVEPHLEYAARVRREAPGRFEKKPDLRPGMHVPHNVLMGVAKKLGIPLGMVMQPGYAERIWQELNSVEYKKFRLHNDKRV